MVLVEVQYVVDEDGDWQDVCEGVVREMGFRVGNNRFMMANRGKPYFHVEVPRDTPQDARQELSTKIAAECARMLDLEHELRTLGVVRRLRDAEAAVKEATALTRRARDAAETLKEGASTAATVVDLAEKAVTAWGLAVRAAALLAG